MSAQVLLVVMPVILGYLVGRRSDMKFVSHLKQPVYAPPSWVFAPVWTVLYIMIGIASMLVWKTTSSALPLILYALQLSVNFVWPLVFARNLCAALYMIIVLLGLIIATGLAFYKVNHIAGWLMLPYFVWVTFATVLTAALCRMNHQ